MNVLIRGVGGPGMPMVLYLQIICTDVQNKKLPNSNTYSYSTPYITLMRNLTLYTNITNLVVNAN